MKRKNRLAVLPKELVDAIKDLKLTEIQEYNAIHFCEIIQKKQTQQELLSTDFVEIPRNYLEQIFQDTRYKVWLNMLLVSIIEVEEFEITIKGEKISAQYVKGKRSISYRINNSLLSKALVKSNFKVIDKRPSNGNSILTSSIDSSSSKSCTLPFRISTVNLPNVNRKNLKKSLITGDMSRLTINRKRLKELVEERVSSLSIADFDTNEEIRYKRSIPVKFGHKGRVYNMPLANAIKLAKESGCDLIQDKKYFRIMERDLFIERKKESIYAAYMSSIMRMNKDYFYAERNTTNNRLDTNLTNMCSILTKQIMEDNDLISIDLNNSQFAILSYVLQDELSTDCFKRFKRLSASGELYDYLKEKFSLSSRKEAKIGCFELLFSSRRTQSNDKDLLKKEFPAVIEWIDAFKKEYGDKNFAKMLQLTESDMFIDNLYCILRDHIDFCLTKHDAFIIKRKDKETALKVITGFFETIKMECTLEIEDGETKTKIEVNLLSKKIVVTKMVENFDIDKCFSEGSTTDSRDRDAIFDRVKRVSKQENWKYLLEDINEYMDIESVDEKHRSLVEEAIVKFK